MTKKFAIVLSGCGVKDGSEIHEAVMTMLAVKKHSGDYQCFAPDIAQHHVTNHLTGQTMKETRNVLVEAARIARGKIKPLSQFNPAEYDALIFPGGFGAAANLCTFEADGANCTVNKDVEKAVTGMFKAQKPIGALCIAPVILGKILKGITVTVGDDKGVNAALHQMGARTHDTTHEEVIIDDKNKIVTAPCYMLDATIAQIATGAENVVKEMIKINVNSEK